MQWPENGVGVRGRRPAPDGEKVKKNKKNKKKD